jgi:hypothetical protein
MTTITHMTKAQMRDTMAKREARISKIGQNAAVKYLNSKHRRKSSGAIRFALFTLMMAFYVALAVAALVLTLIDATMM